MAQKVSEENMQAMRSVLGAGPSDMDIIRSLHLAKNDVTAALNILLDTPGFNKIKRTTAGSGARVSTSGAYGSTNSTHVTASGTHIAGLSDSISSLDSFTDPVPLVNSSKGIICSRGHDDSSFASGPALDIRLTADKRNEAGTESIEIVNAIKSPMKQEDSCSRVHINAVCPSIKSSPLPLIPDQDKANFELLFLGEAEVMGYSTCRGPKLRSGERISFTFPKQCVPKNGRTATRFGGRARGATANSEIVRFSTIRSGEIGRIPGDWARCLIPLVSTGNVKVEGYCRAAPEVLSLMDSIVLNLRVYASRFLFKQSRRHPSNSLASSAEGTVHPVPTLFRLLGKDPFQKAEFTPEDLYNRKRTLDAQASSTLGCTVAKRLKLASEESLKRENVEGEEILTDSDLDRIVGISEISELKEMEPPSTFVSDLRPYQKQALLWMTELETGVAAEEAAKILHPCWEAYHLPDKQASSVYLNVFSGEASMDFPSALQLARGGILADAMGLGKTVMTIALLMANPGRGCLSALDKTTSLAETFSQPRSLQSKYLGNKTHNSLRGGGGTLIVCPMTLIGQWKAELENHVQPGAALVYMHYGPNRAREWKFLLEFDVVLTTYGVLGSEFQSENEKPLHSIHWFRVVLDEAHTIKANKSLSAQASFNLTADRRWCLTGTPIQNKLEDAFSLLHFLRVEPWSNWGWWNKLVQKPFEEGDERGLKLLQAILKPIMLRRTKDSTDKEGRPILVLPPSETQIVECKLSEAEQDFYDALYKKSKVKFDKFVEQGKVLHNYASILELLLRLRQCCDHPFLVLSRGDTMDYADLNKLAKRFLDGGHHAGHEGASQVPSKAYIKEVVEELRKGEMTECPICLEAVEDAVLTPCAHCMCRECLLGSWKSSSGGLCPICRQHMTRQDIITAPTENRFRIDIEKNWTESSKVVALISELECLRTSGAKSIVFSQWTAFLDLLQIPLKRQNFKYVRLDGTLNQQQREQVIKDFSSDPKILVMLISLKAGGVGINLTAASNAFLLDPWWNPAVEEQAVMRIHRIGQTNKVSIKRFITKGTVEERMLQVQARKQRMIAGALTDEEVRSARIEELKMLFR